MCSATPNMRLERARQLMGEARRLGDQLFDPAENLIRHDAGPRPGCVVAQQSLEYAIALLDTRTADSGPRDILRANAVIERVLQFQVRDLGHARYGNFLWMSHWQEPLDPNAAAFLTPQLVFLYSQRGNYLADVTKERLLAAFPGCAAALLRHLVPYEYTNIKLLTTASQFLLAPFLPGSALEETARLHWKHFLAFTAQYGIAEYNSPTYLPVGIEALERLHQFGPQDLRAQFERMLEYFYFELAARFHGPTRMQCGAMSRAYPADKDGQGGLGALVAHLQWGTPAPSPFLNCVRFLPLIYRAPEKLMELALNKRLPIQIEAQQWHGQSVSRTDFQCGHFALGSQSGYYGDQEVPLFATLAPTTQTPHPAPRTLWLESSNPGLARLISRQQQNRVRGTYYMDLDAVRAATQIRKKQPDLDLRLSFVVSDAQTTIEVEADGKRWDHISTTLQDPPNLTMRYGECEMTLRLCPLNSGGNLVLHREGTSVRLEYRLADNAGKYVERDRVDGFCFDLTIAAPGLPVPAQSNSSDQDTEIPDATTPEIPGRVWLHHSPLAALRPNDLLPWLQIGPGTDRPFLPQTHVSA